MGPDPNRVCVGGFDIIQHSNVRLLTPSGENQDFESPLTVHKVIKAVYRRQNVRLKHPHTEDVRLLDYEFLEVTSSDLLRFQNLWPIVAGPIERTFSGSLSREGSMSLSVRESNVPDHSVCFWRLDQPLLQDVDYFERFNKRIYNYRIGASRVRLPFVGLQGAERMLRAGTVVRLSLARWWRPENADYSDKRCQLQLSGWYS